MPIEKSNQGNGGPLVQFRARVVDRNDPENLGRVRIRALGFHTDDVEQLPNEALPWSTVIYPPSPTPTITPPRIGDWVVGHFNDGPMAQQPTVTGVQPTQGGGGYADDLGDDGPSPLADRPSPAVANEAGPAGIGNTQTPEDAVNTTGAGTPGAATGTKPAGIANAEADAKTGIPDGAGGTFDEPPSSYAAVYPYNQAQVSESGHSVEIDDTPGAERVDVRHRTGSGMEFNPGGDMNVKVINNKSEFITGNLNQSITGGQILSIGQGMNVQTSGGAGVILMVDGGGGIDITVTGGDVKINVTGNVDLKATGNITQKCDGAMTLESTGPMVLKGSTVDIN
jgi:hypothetical protein